MVSPGQGVRSTTFYYRMRALRGVVLFNISQHFERVELLVELVELVRVELVRVLVVPVVFCSSSRCAWMLGFVKFSPVRTTSFYKCSNAFYKHHLPFIRWN